MTDRGTRLADDWVASEDDRAYARKYGFSESEILRIEEDFLSFWTTKVGAGALHRLWPRVWQRWVRVEADRRPRGNVVRINSRESAWDRQGREYLESIERLKVG